MQVVFQPAENRIPFGGGKLQVEELFGGDKLGQADRISGRGRLGGNGAGKEDQGKGQEGENAHGDFSVLVVQIKEKSYRTGLIKSKVACNILIFLPSSS